MKKSKGYFEKSAFIVFVFSSLGSLLNLFFQFVSLHMLSVPEYGDLNALLSVTTIVSTIATVASLDAVRFSSNVCMADPVDSPKKSASISQYIFGTLPVFGAITIILSFSSFLLKDWVCTVFNINYKILIPLAVLTGTISIFPSALSGILQGMQKFTAASIVNNVVFLAKLLLSVFLYMLGLSVEGAFVSILLGYILSFFIAAFLLRDILSDSNTDLLKHFSIKEYLFSAGKIMAIQLAISLISNIDIQVVKMYFGQEVTGLYSSAMMIGKVSNYVISALVFVLLPVASSDDGHGPTSQETFTKTLLYTAVVTVLFAAVCTPLYHYLALPVLGKPYSLSEEYIFPIALLFIPVSLITVVATYAIARRKTGFISATIFFGVLSFLLLSYYYHRSVRQVLLIQTGIFAFVFIVMVIKSIIDQMRSEKEETVSEP